MSAVLLEALLSKEILFSNKWSLSVDLRVYFHAVNRLDIVRIAAGIDYRFWIQILQMSYTVHLPVANHIASPHPRQSPIIIKIIIFGLYNKDKSLRTLWLVENHVLFKKWKTCILEKREMLWEHEPSGTIWRDNINLSISFHPKFPEIFLLMLNTLDIFNFFNYVATVKGGDTSVSLLCPVLNVKSTKCKQDSHGYSKSVINWLSWNNVLYKNKLFISCYTTFNTCQGKHCQKCMIITGKYNSFTFNFYQTLNKLYILNNSHKLLTVFFQSF